MKEFTILLKKIQLATGKEFENLIILLGNFHLIKTGLACVGRYLRESGIEYLLVEAGIFGVNVVDQVLQGSNYARSIKGFFLIAEVLERLQLQQFFDKHNDAFENEVSLLIDLQESFNAGEFDLCKTFMSDFKNQSQNFIECYKNFEKRRSEEFSLFKYWNNTLKMIRLIRNLLRADRSGNFALHVECIKKMQPLFHIMDRINYTRWCSVYLNDLLGLQENYPAIYEEFVKGNSVVKATDIPFSSVGPDQRLEQTANRSKKSVGEIIGQTNIKEYVNKWNLIHHEMLAIDICFNEVTFVTDENYEVQVRKNFSVTNMENSELLIQNLMKLIVGERNPFQSGSMPLKNLLTEEKVNERNSQCLLQLFSTGCELFEIYRLERFQNRTKALSVALKRFNLPTFKTPDTKEAKKPISDEKDDKMSQRMFEIARLRKYSIKRLLAFEGTQKDMLFNDKGLLNKEKIKVCFDES